MNQTEETGYAPQGLNDAAQPEVAAGESVYLGRENLDLQAIGGLLERADNPEEFEYLLNTEYVNNLDLNEDGYADYISVAEFGEGYDDERGLSLFSQFGPDLIQEIASIFFDRGGFDGPGARILMTGNEQLYGDNHFYEANWLDRSLSIVNSLFGNRNDVYDSPYYYGNYPDYYEPYEIVETPVYRTRVVEYYPDMVFVQTAAPTITEIRIRSPYDDRTVRRADLPKHDRERVAFKEKNPNWPEVVPVKKGHRKDVPPRSFDKEKGKVKGFDKPGRGNFERPNKVKNDEPRGRSKPNKNERKNVSAPKPNKPDKPNAKPSKPDNRGKQKVGDNRGGGRGNGGGEKAVKANNGGSKAGNKAGRADKTGGNKAAGADKGGRNKGSDKAGGSNKGGGNKSRDKAGGNKGGGNKGGKGSGKKS